MISCRKKHTKTAVLPGLLAILSCVVLSTMLLAEDQKAIKQNTFYVDAVNGNDDNIGSITTPFSTLNKALNVVSYRVNHGITSDKIYLRAGVYKNDGFSNQKRDYTLYNVNLKGTVTDPSVISAMPCKPGTAGCIQGKSGNWYEKVVFDDGYTIPSGIWKRYNQNIWYASPGYINSKWGGSSPGKKGHGISWMAGANSDYLTIGPRMLLQEGKPFFWKDPWPDYNPLGKKYNPAPAVGPESVLTGPGMRTFDQDSGILYIWPFEDKDPNTVKMESWKGTTQDVRFRHMIEGSMEHVEIKGIEFRLFTSLFQADLLGNYRYVKWEDNIFAYGWKHLLSDPQNISLEQRNLLLDWEVRYNIFYRPSREVFQVYGDNHIFEFNDIIEHGGSWAGGAAMVSAINIRHMNNALIRGNYINHLGNKWHSGTAIMVEADTEQRDDNGNCVYGGTTIENNFIGKMQGGVGIYLGRGGCRMKDITIRNNVFAVNPGNVRYKLGLAIEITSPHNNLQIHNNVFYDQKKVFRVRNDRGGMKLEDMQSSISIRDNIFMNSNYGGGSVIHSRLSAVAEIGRNIFFNNRGSPVGKNAIVADPLFNGPSAFDFTLKAGSPAIQKGPDIGAYGFGEEVPLDTAWWRRDSYIDKYKQEIK